LSRSHPSLDEPGDAPLQVPKQPSLIDVRDSWIESTQDRPPAASTADGLPAIRPPAITLPEDALELDYDDGVDVVFPEYDDDSAAQLRTPSARNPPGGRASLPSVDGDFLVAELMEAAARETWQPEPASAELPPSSVRRTTTSPPARSASDIDPFAVPALEDLPEDVCRAFLAFSRELVLGPSTTLGGFEALLVVRGSAQIAAGSRGPTVRCGPLDLVTVRTSAQPGDALHAPAVARADHRTVVLLWDREEIDRTIRLCPWFADALRDEGDRLNALLHLAGTLPGPLWREIARLNDLTRLRLRRVAPHELFLARGCPVEAAAIVGKGALELTEDERVVARLRPGDLLCAPQVLSGGAAPLAARGGPDGASLLVANTDVLAASLKRLPVLARRLQQPS